jgi:hypothetical protein
MRAGIFSEIKSVTSRELKIMLHHDAYAAAPDTTRGDDAQDVD